MQYLLVVATPISIRLLALHFRGNSVHNQVFCYDTGLHCQTEGAGINKIAGTNDGRIFLVGDSELVHEVVYSSRQEYDSSWTGLVGLSSRCFLEPKQCSAPSSWFRFIPIMGTWNKTVNSELIDVAIDNHRHLLYTLSTTGIICAYNLGQKGGDIWRFAEVKSLGELCNQWARSYSDQSTKRFGGNPDDVSAVWPLLQIHVLSPSESRHIHLVVVSESGVRLYFSTANNFSDNAEFGKALELRFIRFPPRPDGRSSGNEIANIDNDKVYHSSCVAGGVTVAAFARQDQGGIDDAVAMAFDHRVPMEQRKGFDESYNMVPVSEHGGEKVHSLEAEPVEPSLLRDVVYLPSGAIALPNGETAPEAVSPAEWDRGVSNSGFKPGLLGSLASVFVNKARVGEKRPRESNVPADVTGPRLGHEYESPIKGIPDGLQHYFERVMRRRMWAGFDEVPSHIRSNLNGSYGGGGSLHVLTNLDTQHENGLRQSFVCLTQDGLRRLKYVCPLEQLFEILEDNSKRGVVGQQIQHKELDVISSRVRDIDRAQNNELQRFLEMFGPQETCAMLIAIGSAAITESGKDHRQMATDALKSNRVVYDSMLEGLSLYMCRLLRSFWTCSIFISRRKAEQGPQYSSLDVECRFTEQEMISERNKLKKLREFMDYFYGDISLMEKSQRAGQNAEDHGRRFVVCLYALLDRACQALAVMRVISKHCRHLPRYLLMLEHKSLLTALDMTYEGIVCKSEGLVLIRFLLGRLTEGLRGAADESNQSADDMDIDGTDRDHKSFFFTDLQQTLQQEAPYYFTQEDFEMWQAFISFDLARRSAVTTSTSDQTSKLRESLSHAKKACKQWSLQRCLSQIHELCLGYAELGYYDGVISLCCTAAKEAAGGRTDSFSYNDLKEVQRLDTTQLYSKVQNRQNLSHKKAAQTFGGLSDVSLEAANAYYDGDGTQLNSSQKLLQFRLECYAILITLIEKTIEDPSPTLVEQVRTHQRFQQSAANDRLGEQENDGMLCFDFLIKQVLQFHDFLLHERIYERLLDTGFSSILVRCDGKYLEDFLKRNPESGELLVEYYKVQERYVDAAYLQRARADESSLDSKEDQRVSLTERIRRLDSAISFAFKSSTLSSGSIDRNKLDEWKRARRMAGIQYEILTEVEKRRASIPNAEYVIHQLDSQLLHINTLYHDFAWELKLHGPCLAILDFSNSPHSQEWRTTVEKVWVRGVIREIYDNSSSGEIIANLTKTIGDLGRRFWSHMAEQAVRNHLTDRLTNSSEGSIVPLLRLTDEIEMVCFKRIKFDVTNAGYHYHPGWFCVDTLDRVAVPWSLRYEVYSAIIGKKTGNEELHFIEAISSLVDAWVSNCHNATTERDKIRELHEFCNRLIKDISRSFLPRVQSRFSQNTETVQNTQSHFNQDFETLQNTLQSIHTSLQDFQMFARNI